MRWDAVAVAWTDRLEADPALMQLLGGARIYPANASRPVEIPSVEYLPVVDQEGELFNTIRVQVDFWAHGTVNAWAIEKRLRLLTHHDTAQVLAGMRLWMRYLDGRTVEYPAAPGVVHRILDFEFELIRGKYSN